MALHATAEQRCSAHYSAAGFARLRTLLLSRKKETKRNRQPGATKHLAGQQICQRPGGKGQVRVHARPHIQQQHNLLALEKGRHGTAWAKNGRRRQ